jgi:phospholipid/cholesterol/gamma-HCH transport system substrate-binding protein
MKRLNLELVVGVFVLIGLVSLGYLSVRFAKMEMFGRGGYTVYAEFDNIGGLKPGASVEIAGVQVGRVKSITLTEDYLARVEMVIDRNVKLQEDAIVSIKTKGLIGEKYVEITPGGSEEIVAEGEKLSETESAIDIEDIISRFVFGKLE